MTEGINITTLPLEKEPWEGYEFEVEGEFVSAGLFTPRYMVHAPLWYNQKKGGD